MLDDLRYGFRQLFRERDFSLVTISTLALAMGAVTVIFSVLHAVVLRPLPLPEPDRLLRVYSAFEGEPGLTSPGNFLFWSRENHSFAAIAALRDVNVTLSDGEQVLSAPAARVTGEYFSVLLLAPARGRTFDPLESELALPVAVISTQLWQDRFGGEELADQAIRIDEVPHRVVGVMPPEMDFQSGSTDLWLPLDLSGSGANFGSGYLSVVARLGPGVTLTRAQQEMDVLVSRLRELAPEANQRLEVRLAPLAADLVGDYGARLLVLSGAVLLVLLIACANVANLLLARGAARGREMAVRSALGATPWRILRQLLTENLMMALCGSALGVLAGAWCLDLVLLLGPPDMPRLSQARIDGYVFLVMLLVGAAAGLVFGLLPALRGSRSDLQADLQEGDRGGALSAPGDRLQQALVVAEVCLTLILLVGSAVLIRSAISLGGVEPGLDPSQVLTARIALPHSRYGDAELTVRTYQRVLESVRGIPGVQVAGLVSRIPSAGSGGMGWSFESQPGPDGAAVRRFESALRFASPGYFQSLGIPLRRGRDFRETDRADSPQVVIVNQRLTQLLWGSADPLGQPLRILDRDAPNPLWEVIGVVGNVRYDGPMQEPRAEFYLPLSQVPDGPWYWSGRALYLTLRTSSPPDQYVEPVRAALASVDPSLPLQEPLSMEARLAQSVAAVRFNTFVLTSLGMLGLALAAVGIYSVAAHYVVRRGRELGLRVALGASQGELRRLVLFRALWPVMVGLGLGITGALALSSVLSALLFGISAADPVTFLVMGGLLLAVAAAACLRPLQHALQLDPGEVLRSE